MCELCTEAETHVLLAEAEREIILAEADNGDSIASASRPLSDKERAAKVRFRDIENLEDTELRRAETVLRTLRSVVVRTLVSELLRDAKEVTPAEAVARLRALAEGPQPKKVREAVEKAISAFQSILQRTYTGGASIVREEAERQKADTIPKELPEPESALFTAAALTVATQPWSRVTSRLQTTLLDPRNLFEPSLSRPMVLDNLEDIPLDGAVDLARQTIHSAHGLGRNDTAELMQPADAFSSELMDGNTCGPCSRVDGRDYETMAAVRADYPAGGYRSCDGGLRCRGSAVFLF